MKSALPRLVVVLAASLALSACGAGDGTGFAADFSLASRDGKTVTLSSQKGRVVLLNFWATWCDSCKEELPALQALKISRLGERFELLTVNVDDDPPKTVPAFAAKYGLKFPILYVDRKTMDAYAVRMLPTTFLIGPDGSIVRRYVGPLDAHAVENDILSLLNRSPS